MITNLTGRILPLVSLAHNDPDPVWKHFKQIGVPVTCCTPSTPEVGPTTPQLALWRCAPNRQELARQGGRRPPTDPSSAQSCAGCRSWLGPGSPPSSPRCRTPHIPGAMFGW